jgi:hypothetical protein
MNDFPQAERKFHAGSDRQKPDEITSDIDYDKCNLELAPFYGSIRSLKKSI